MKLQSYQATLDYLYAQLPMFQRVGAAAFKKDLSNTLALCEHLGQPQEKFPSIHVAGTNGKGSTSHIIAGVLQAHGLKVGLYTSPHYKDFRERIKINGQFIPKKYIVGFVNAHLEKFESIQPSFFEWTVALAFDYFAHENVDIAVIEVGMGGRLDSTNVIKPLVSVITNISFDHMQFLGDTLPKIAFEKAGIIKPDIPVVIGQKHPETMPVFQQRAAEGQSPIYFAEDHLKATPQSRNLTHTRYTIFKNGKTWLQDLSVNLTGNYQHQNLTTALQSLLVLEGREPFPELRENPLREALENLREQTTFMGRWQLLSQHPTVMTDSAHNEDGLRWAMQQLREVTSGQLHMVIGAVNDKDLGKMLQKMPADAKYYFAKPNIPRGLDARELKNQALPFGLHGKAYSSVRLALAAAKKSARAEDFIYVGGSTFVVAEVL